MKKYILQILKLIRGGEVPQLPNYLQTKVHGQTRTLVDMLIELNKLNRYTSPGEALKDLWGHLEHLRTDGDEVAFNCSVRSINAFADQCFPNGTLDVKLLESKLNQHDFYDGIDAVYKDYVVEKTVTLIAYLNDFRRYTNPNQLMSDFLEATGGVNACGSNKDNYYFSFSHYVDYFLKHYLTKFWDELTINGTLDNEIFYDFMIGRHSRGIKKYGLEAVIKRNFQPNSCHKEAYAPYRGGAAPVYVKSPFFTSVNLSTSNRRFIKSCGEGVGPNSVRDYFEFSLIQRLLEFDEKYVFCDNKYDYDSYIPKYDDTLPVFTCAGYRVNFDSEETKKAFLKEMRERCRRRGVRF
ncbi:hypothetical protein M2480_003210 [Parabacteroides sp. PFB2-12]|uniref:hypothetical protein n=1 Tax=Parabacteroides sp. PFB2-12 TaxID=2940652 RepID=UPI002472F01A|nr:hypothetical protein [Parabacteroides sp. PFB2-12]MDH6392201.1 hypothetical protein [Parabacteroides sp. PFB2-12]